MGQNMGRWTNQVASSFFDFALRDDLSVTSQWCGGGKQKTDWHSSSNVLGFIPANSQ